jgi:hypothetical protein
MRAERKRHRVTACSATTDDLPIPVLAYVQAHLCDTTHQDCAKTAKIDLGNNKGAVLLDPDTYTCLEGSTYKTQCILVNGECKLEQIPGPASCFLVKEFTWQDLFYGADWPDSPSYLAPAGSFSMRSPGNKQGPPIAGLVLTTSFIADNAAHKISWVGAQSIPSVAYTVPNGASSVTVSLSETRADMNAECTVSLRSGNLFYGPAASVPECRTVPGKKYWLSIHYADSDLNPAINTCNPNNFSGGVKCDSNFSAR